MNLRRALRTLSPVVPLSLLVLGAHAAPTRGAAPTASAAASSSARAPAASASTSAAKPAAPDAPRAKESTLERVATEIATSFPSAPQALLVAGPALRSDEPLSRADELLFRALSVVSGKLPAGRAHREPVTLAQARALAGRSGGLLFVDVSIDKGKLRVVTDLYPPVDNAWERWKNPLPEPTGHRFVEVPIDAEIRSFLPPIMLERATVHRARVDEDVNAIGCGDFDGDGGLDLVLLSDKRALVGHAQGRKLVVDRSVPFSRSLTRAPVPLREPLASVVIEPRGAARLWVGTTDYGGVLLDDALEKADSTPRIPIATPRGVMCATPHPESSTFDGPLLPCRDGGDRAELAAPLPRFDAYAFTALVGKSGASNGLVVAAREPGGKMRLTKGDVAVTVEGVGAELALSDLDQDGIAEIVTSSEGNDDALHVQSWDGGSFRTRLRIPAPAGIRAVTVCPPEARGAPFIAAVVGSEVWLVR